MDFALCYVLSNFFKKGILSNLYVSSFTFFVVWLRYVALEILVLQPGIKLVYPALGVQNLNHRTTREVPNLFFFNLFYA